MNPQSATSEIVESTEHLEFMMNQRTGKRHMMLKSGISQSMGDDINSLFQAIDIRTSVSKSQLYRSAMKRPIRVGPSQPSGIGISEHVSLKQALRGLSISQASEMAALKKRLPKQASTSTSTEGGGIRRLYRAVIVEADGSEFPSNAGKGNLVEISVVSRNISSVPSSSAETSEYSMTRLASLAKVDPAEAENGNEILTGGLKKVKSSVAPLIAHNKEKVLDLKMKTSALIETPKEPLSSDREQGNKEPSFSSRISSGIASKFNDSARMAPRLLKPVFRNKSFMKRKVKQPSTSDCNSKNPSSIPSTSDLGPSTSCMNHHIDKSESGSKENPKASPVSSSNHSNGVSSSSITDTCSSITSTTLSKSEDKSRSRGKGEFSQSSKSSLGDYSSTTSISEDSNSLSGSSRIGTRPHMSKDIRWECINSVKKQDQLLDWRHFKLLKKLGSGDIATVYLAELSGSNCLFALKVMDKEFLMGRKKMLRAQTEREILQVLDHPFLPTLYAHFTTDKLSCLVMEHCPGGDLHVLRQRQLAKSFSEHAARFYAAEVLLALEYLHMLGVVYRDLKPENILVREDGHIMLSDFDLSLRCSVNPTLVKSTSPSTETKKRSSSPCTGQSCIDPFCVNPSFQMSCFTPKLLSFSTKARTDQSEQVSPFPQLIVEPTEARSNSFVGTHEYLAPEIIKGKGHGSAVDWWTYGIFLFELLYGKTPFKGSSGNDETLSNVVSQTLSFPSCPIVSSSARDLIRGLLVKEPENRLGFVKGSVEIKQHPFFEGLNWALIRCATPPELPKLCETRIDEEADKENGRKCEELQCIQESMRFDMF